MIVQPAPQAPILDLAFANGYFHLRDTNGVFRSADGLDWEWANADTVFQDTRVGDLWFRVVEEGGPYDGIYASPDRTIWRKTNALRIPQQFGDGLYVFTISQRIADGSVGNLLHFGFSPDGIHWSLLQSARDGGALPGNRFHGRIGSQWLTSRWRSHSPGRTYPEFIVSSDGLSWNNLSWPGDTADPDLPYTYAIYFGEGQFFVLRRRNLEEGNVEIIGFHTENLVDWNVTEVQGADGLSIMPPTETSIIRHNDSFVIRSRWTESFAHPTAPVTYHFADLQTSDFADFDVLQQASLLHINAFASVGQRALNPVTGVELEIVLSENNTALLRRENSTDNPVVFEDFPPSRRLVNSVARLGERLYMAGTRSVSYSDDEGATWELSKELPSGGMTFEPPGARMPRITGIFNLVALHDSVWFATRSPSGQVWRKSATEETWTLVRELPGANLQYFAAEGEAIVLTGTRDGTAFLEWSMDGEIWERHEFVEAMAQLRVRFAEGKFWLAGASADGQQGWVLSSDDLRSWETVKTTNNGSFSDVAKVNGTLVLAERNFHTVDYPTRYFIPLPDGSLLDNRGRHTADGFTWTTVEGFDFAQPTRLTVLGDTLYQIDFTTRPISHFSYYSQYNFSLVERYALVFGEDVPRCHVFSADEQISVDGRVLTKWGEFRQLAPGWFDHERMGILHAPANTKESYWYWMHEDEAWAWLHPDLYPFFYDATRADWVYLGGEVPGWRYTYADSLWLHEPLRDGRTFDLPPAPAHPLLYVPAGTFLMGTQFHDWQAHPDEFPAHLVEIEEGFWFAAFETTQAEFARVMGYNPAPPEHRSARFPALNVTLAEAMEYCERLTEEGHAAGWLPETHAVRLPTEAQWEYAARAGVWAETLTAYAKATLLWRFLPNYGHFMGFDPARGNVSGAPAPATGPLPVGSLPPPRADFPAHDTHGNVWEWCRNPYYLYDPEGDYPEGSLQAVDLGYTTARGGGWRSDDRDVRLTNRTALAPEFRSDDVGFRLIIERAD